MIIETALLCLAINVYHESRGEPVTGQYGVALVTINRAKQEDRVCKEVFRRKQFSWTGAVQKTGAGWSIPAHMIPRDTYSWEKAKRIAKVTLAGKMFDITHGATFYHAPHAALKNWMRVMEPTKRIGAHQFYRQPIK